ncbi:exodeoxyribonuclease I [Candidatus Saccharibacteria bacterium]|nr:exodeoxyribonuclease I [Candidatus Saccharibacteria bacterium]
MDKTFFFYDLETSGLNPRSDRIMQFAGQRTDMDLNPIGEPVNILVKLSNDVLPSPGAIMVTKITPQQTLRDGITEAEFCKIAINEVFTPDTIALGFNTVRFDDEFMRATLWRNFYDPYEWEWKDGRSRWDMLDVVRLVRAIRPEGINWPFTDDGRPTNRLELLTKLNGLEHEHAHDALSDVYATIAVARLIKEKQPDMFKFMLMMRDKRDIKKYVNLENKMPFVYASGRYESEFNKTTVAFPLTSSRNGNILVFDLRYNLDDLKKRAAEKDEDADGMKDRGFFPYVKEFCFNKCPAIAPITVLDKFDGWKKIGLSKEIIEKNLNALLADPDFAEQMRMKIENRPEYPPAIEPEGALYDGFLDDFDRAKVRKVSEKTENELADYHPNFSDERLPELLLHYKGRNFPRALSEDEMQKWEEYRHARLERLAPVFLSELAQNYERDEFVGEELKLYFESLFDTDY